LFNSTHNLLLPVAQEGGFQQINSINPRFFIGEYFVGNLLVASGIAIHTEVLDIRAKRNTVYYHRCSHPIDKSAGIRSDQTIQLTGPKTSRLYPIPLRRITFRDEEQRRTFVFLTNHFQLDALTICQLYKLRWQIELFFKWIKQHLRIKSFFGTSINAVKTQIWIAISVYVLVAIIKKELKLERSLHEILQIISILLFEKTPLKQALTENSYDFKEQQNYNQLSLFNL